MDARALPQFRLPPERVPARDDSDVVETVERPPVRIRRVRVTPPRMNAVRPSQPENDPLAITSEVDARDILLEMPAMPATPGTPAVRPARPPLPSACSSPRTPSRPSLPPPNPPLARLSRDGLKRTIPGVAPPPAPPEPEPTTTKSVNAAPAPPASSQDQVGGISFSSLGLPSDRHPEPLPAIAPPTPPAPITLPLLADRDLSPIDLPPISGFAPVALPVRRGTLETTPSLAPVAMATPLVVPTHAADAADASMPLRPRRRRPSGALAALSLVAVATIAGAAVASVVVVREGMLGQRGVALVERLTARTHEEPRARAVATAPPVSAAPTPPVVAEPAVVPAPAVATLSVPVDALPAKPAIEPELALVTLPRSSKGHRIFVDGRVVGTGPAPMKIKCGTHKIQIGSAGKPRVTELPCGGELTLD